MKKAMRILLAMMVSTMMVACSSGGAAGTADEAEKENASEAEKGAESESASTTVESIDMAFDEGSIKYAGFEKANPDLTDEENDYVFYFDFTNLSDEPSQAQDVFYIQFFQNGAELKNNVSWSSKGGDQYEVVSAFFNEALKDGTIHFGKIVVVNDNSPVTVMVKGRSSENREVYQMMEVDLGGDGKASESKEETKEASYTAEDIEKALNGTWLTPSNTNAETSFDNGSLVISDGNNMLSGTYEIDVDKSQIIGHIEASDGTLKITIPFEYKDGNLTVYNNAGDALIKK